MNEVLKFYLDKINQSAILKSLGFKKGSYFVVSSHREENVDNPRKLDVFISTLNDLAESIITQLYFLPTPELENN